MAETKIPDHKKGDTFDGYQITVTYDGGAFPNDLASVIFTAKPQPQSSTKHQLSTGGNGITIADAANWIIQIDEQMINWPAFNYYYDIQFTDVNGRVKTYVYGRWNITQDIT